ncbi:MAG: PEGA domain-containing protein [Anaerotignum sp.]|nr:PEGA domain-containing protein [Anaerotignum sp.]
MKDYHFQDNEQDFGLTVRLDDINEKVKQLQKDNEEDDLGDANAFLNAFESEKFDIPAEEFPEEEEEIGDTIQPVPVKPARRQAEPILEEEEWDEPEEEGTSPVSKKTIGLIAALAVIACIIGFSFVRCGFGGGSAPAKPSGQASPMLVESVLDVEEAVVYDIVEEERRTLTLTEKTTVTDEQGNAAVYSGVEMGDLIMVELDKDGKTALSIDYSDASIQSVETTDLKVDASKNRLVGEDTSYEYGKKALFLHEGEEISPKELEPCDLLELKLVEDTVWVVDVLEYHGYIEVENADNIKDGMIQLDEEEAVPLEKGMKLAVRAGQHAVTVTGSNIETRKDTLFVEAGEDFIYDLSKAQEKVGVIIVNANVGDYKLFINGALAESPAVLPMGEYDLVVLKNGYREWSQHVKLDQDSLTVNAELQKDVQYGALNVTADVDGAWVYINGEEYGVTPLHVNLPYGSYRVQVMKEGHGTFRQNVAIQSSVTSISATLE